MARLICQALTQARDERRVIRTIGQIATTQEVANDMIGMPRSARIIRCTQHSYDPVGIVITQLPIGQR